MKISIAQRHRPFSHWPGASCILPRTCWVVHAFPAMIRLQNLERHNSQGCIEIPLELTGPVREFTLEQDLEKGYVRIWGVANEGRFRIRLEAVKSEIQLHAERTPSKGLIAAHQAVQAGQSLGWPVAGPFRESIVLERLSLGSHRCADWDSIWRKFDLTDILPILFHLGQWMPSIETISKSEMLRLLDQGWDSFLRAAFSSMLCPRLIDDQFQGLLCTETIPALASACELVSAAALKVRCLFVEQHSMDVQILPFSQFISGRMVNVHLSQIGQIDLEWRQQTIRRMILCARHDANVHFKWPKSVRSFRLRNAGQERGSRVNAGEALDLKMGKIYWFDQFQK
jgi:hypothetical protein